MNKIILMGNLGNDPENRYSANGNAVTKFSLATNKQVKGETVTSWHNCICFKKTAEIITEHCKKGSRIAVMGEVEYREDGDKRYTNIIVREFWFAGQKGADRGNDYRKASQGDGAPDDLPPWP